MSNSALAIVRACQQAYVDKDRARIEALLDDDYHFTSPIDNALDRATYFKICWPNSSVIARFENIYEFEQGDRAFVVYEAHTSTGKRFRNSEAYTVRGGKLVATEVYFGWNVPHNVPRGTHMEQTNETSGGTTTPSGPNRIVSGVWGVRYQVKDVSRSIAFYTQQLGFTLDRKNLPAFGQVSLDGFKLILSGPGASGSRPVGGGQQQEPGGWNRVILRVSNLPAQIEALKKSGLHFRNEMEVGPGGKQIQLEDPDGNPLELFEPAG